MHAAPKLEQAAGRIEEAVRGGKVRAAVLDVRQGSFAFRRAFGAAEAESVFLVASISKPFTAAGVMLLADRGELALDDPAHKFLPEFTQGVRRKITIRHLLTHTSGLPDQLPDNFALRKRHAPLAEFVRETVRTPLLFEPGTRVSYQSMGILLAAEVAQRITGTPFPAFLHREVFTPLGMTRTALGLGKLAFEDTLPCQVKEASEYASGDTSAWDWNSVYWRNLAAPWGGAFSTAGDITSFLHYFLDPDSTVLNAGTARSMVVNHTGLAKPWGLGFLIRPGAFGTACSRRTFGHWGATGTSAWADPVTGTTCVLLTTWPYERSHRALIRPVSNLVSESV